MQQMPRNYPNFDPRFRMQQQRQQQPPAPRRRWRFRWGIVWVVLAILGAVWFLNGVEVAAFEWEDVMRALHVPRRAHDRYTRFAVLAIVGIALTLIVKVWRKR